MYDAGPQGLNRYSYALNNPIIYCDPTGHFITGPDDENDPGAYGSITGSQEQLNDGTARVHHPDKNYTITLSELEDDPTFLRKTTKNNEWTGVFHMRAECSGWGRNCTATLIDPKVALTAAHCMMKDNNVTYHLENRKHEELVYGKLEPHKLYDEVDLRNDIALLLLDEEVNDYEVYALDSQEPEIGEKGITLGYGYGSTHNPALIGTTFTNFTNSNSMTSPDSSVIDTELQEGDSGGPTFVMRNDQWYITGVSSSTNTLYKESSVTPVYRHVDWIDNMVLQHTGHHLGKY